MCVRSRTHHGKCFSFSIQFNMFIIRERGTAFAFCLMLNRECDAPQINWNAFWVSRSRRKIFVFWCFLSAIFGMFVSAAHSILFLYNASLLAHHTHARAPSYDIGSLKHTQTRHSQALSLSFCRTFISSHTFLFWPVLFFSLLSAFLCITNAECNAYLLLETFQRHLYLT